VYHCTIDLLFDWFGISCMTTDNFCFYLQNRLIKSSQTGGQWYSDTSTFSIPCSFHIKSPACHTLRTCLFYGPEDVTLRFTRTRYFKKLHLFLQSYFKVVEYLFSNLKDITNLIFLVQKCTNFSSTNFNL
jgi:hypothetical protein